MPINPSALGDSTPEPEPQPQSAPEETGKRKRRSKAEMIADAVVPADNEQVELKDSGTGAKIERPWLVAVEMVRDGKAEWSDKAMKYALIKYDQQKTASAFETSEGPAPQEPMDAADMVEPSGPTPSSSEPPAPSAPPEAEVGDEVRMGADVFRVGHGGQLTSGPVSVNGDVVQPKRTWQRELGTGVNGPWEVVHVHPAASKPETNGKAEVTVETETQPAEIRQVGEVEWKVGTGILRKIGLPQVEQYSGGSQLQIGPITASRTVLDDGRRTTVPLGDREGAIPTAVLEAFQELTDTAEYVARYQTGELVSFLEATGVLTQPVSS